MERQLQCRYSHMYTSGVVLGLKFVFQSTNYRIYDCIVLYGVGMHRGGSWGLLQVRIYVVPLASLCVSYLEVSKVNLNVEHGVFGFLIDESMGVDCQI